MSDEEITQWYGFENGQPEKLSKLAINQELSSVDAAHNFDYGRDEIVFMDDGNCPDFE